MLCEVYVAFSETTTQDWDGLTLVRTVFPFLHDAVVSFLPLRVKRGRLVVRLYAEVLLHVIVIVRAEKMQGIRPLIVRKCVLCVVVPVSRLPVVVVVRA